MNVARVSERYSREWTDLRQLVAERSFEYGDFTLTSGKKSSYYFDGKQVTLYPEGAYLIGKIILEKIRGLNINAVGGCAIGADPMVGALATVAYLEGISNLNLFIVRKEPKKHGKLRHIEGPLLNKGDRVVIVDDIISTGGSILQSINVIKEFECEIVKVVAVVDRQEGGTQMIQKLGIDVDPIFTIEDFNIRS
jgi:orotate phosphoribosyltransferase